MPFITQGKTNWKFLLIVAVLVVVIGGGIFWYSKEQIKPPIGVTQVKPPRDITQDTCSIDSDCQFYCGCGCVLKDTPGCPNPNFACEYDSCNSCRCLEGQCVSWSEVFIEAQHKKDINLCREIQNKSCKEQCLVVLGDLLREYDEPADWQTYRDEEMEFEIKFPRGDWGQVSKSNTYVLFGGELERRFPHYALDLSVEITNQGLDDYISDYNNTAMCQLGPPPEIESIKEVGNFMIGGKNATRLKACSDYLGTNIAIIFTTHNNKNYIIKSFFHENIHESIHAGILSTFRFMEEGGIFGIPCEDLSDCSEFKCQQYGPSGCYYYLKCSGGYCACVLAWSP